MPTSKPTYAIVKLESYEGDSTFIRCGDDQQDYMFLIVHVDPDGSADILDCGYRAYQEAAEAWPEAAPMKSGAK
jgi:hypothetical protein